MNNVEYELEDNEWWWYSGNFCEGPFDTKEDAKEDFRQWLFDVTGIELKGG